MKRLVPAFGVPLILAVGLGQGDTRLPAALPVASGYGHISSLDPLPGTLAQTLMPHALVPNPALPSVPTPHGPGDVIPHTYMVYGLRTGPGSMAFTDANGAAIPVPSNPQIILKPFHGLPVVPPATSPPMLTLPRSIPTPKK